MLDGVWSGRSELCGAELGAGAPIWRPVRVEDVGVPAGRDDRLVCRVPDSEDHLGVLSERPRPGQPAPAGIAPGARQRLRAAISSLRFPGVAAGEFQQLRPGCRPGAFRALGALRALARPARPGPGIVQLERLSQERR